MSAVARRMWLTVSALVSSNVATATAWAVSVHHGDLPTVLSSAGVAFAGTAGLLIAAGHFYDKNA